MPEPTIPSTLKAMEPSQLQAIVWSLREALVIADPQGNLVMANPAALAMFGYEGFEEAPKHRAAYVELLEFFDAQGRLVPHEQWPLSRALRGETFSNCEFLVCRNDNGKQWTASYSGSPVRDSGGNVVLGVVAIRDISDRKRAEDLLERERDNLLNVLEAMPDGICIVDQEYRIQYANSVVKHFFGPPGAHKCYEYFHPRSEPCPWCRNAEVFAGNAHRWEWHSQRAGRTFDRIASPLRNANGTISKLEIFHDITDLKQTEERIQRLHADLAHIDRLRIMGEMATGLAHELNQPLTAILMQAELALRKLELGRALNADSMKKTWERIADQADRAGQIIRRMREFVRKTAPNRAPLDFGELVDEMLSLVRGDLGHHRIEIALDLPALPKIVADKIQVQQVLLNLVQNAVEAMEDTPVERRTLGIGAKVRGGVLEISVSDTGHGIPAGDCEKLFSTFHTTKAHGLGLGLAICRTIVEQHGGHIGVAPNGDRGSIFTLTLPIADESRSES